KVVYDDLRVPPEVLRRVRPDAGRLALDHLAPLLRPRPRDAHKGCFGHVLVLGGDRGMSGAARMAGEAA
ncbi:MAG: bifunctional ADP-dependent NAD(P)H-hydrate dehydratase/NAD(P)H-hydrate epimerase, partial [Gammaproteobacteria bacterium]|nr:bifunctional ADP-dependent NAD(P)H-hydrate dehydratase/NAD(P)H-hydrate epimerase [Gammaproteobacteria bacterium]NIT63341.1 bifunctional ADP-dependent NAD(P)H-hydrate dehydratase/NAD(P)H-hydrate epimerase [Gammaproteobacteria bacterium]NIV20261.1 bifunctional ADP-dependent NAD(P)H-hydrate dehydratase/NAD(P)H-hydrate epimerase [Gammaproteobacteria bacterium]NIY31921.1 bifunctional ADP-dependent NAD(P)H-hydrate dehydratase/NAD(P)H-hydrate epimerase [Gammaproteobacteria bacterium]